MSQMFSVFLGTRVFFSGSATSFAKEFCHVKDHFLLLILNFVPFTVVWYLLIPILNLGLSVKLQVQP